MAHLGRDRVLKPCRVRPAAEKRSRCLINEAVGDTFVVSQRCRRTPRDLLALLGQRQNGFRNAGSHAGQRTTFKLGQRGDTCDLFDQVSFTHHIRTPRRWCRHVAVHLETKRGQRLALDRFRDFHPDKALDPCRFKLVGAINTWRVASDNHVRCFTATKLKDHGRGQFQAVTREFWVHPTLKPVFCVRVDFQRAG